MLLCGIDENGLGPRLGPLVATAVVLQLPRYDAERLCALGAEVGLGDSKQTSGFGAMAMGESVALAMLQALHGVAPRDFDEFLQQVSLDAPAELRRPCPESTASQCWSSTIELPAFGGSVERGRACFEHLARHGVTLARARSTIACASVVNSERKRLGSRSRVDLSLFERLLLDARAAAGEDIEAVLGFVGGIRDYPSYFDHLKGRPVEVLKQQRQVCEYRVQGVGKLVFEVDADAHHLPVSLASMLGKYVRELSMERQNRYYLALDPALPRPSGYHDPVTKRFVEQSDKLRRRLGIVGNCFER